MTRHWHTLPWRETHTNFPLSLPVWCTRAREMLRKHPWHSERDPGNLHELFACRSCLLFVCTTFPNEHKSSLPKSSHLVFHLCKWRQTVGLYIYHLRISFILFFLLLFSISRFQADETGFSVSNPLCSLSVTRVDSSELFEHSPKVSGWWFSGQHMFC